MNLWKNGHFRNLAFAEITTVMGDEACFIILLKWVEVATKGDAGSISWLYIWSYLPSVLFFMVASAWVERRTLQKIMISSDFVRAGMYMVLPFLMTRLDWHWAYVAVFLDGVFALFYFPAHQSLLPHLIQSQEQRTQANSILGASYLTFKVAAHILAAFLIGKNVSLPFLISVCVLLWGISAFFVSQITPWVKNIEVQETSSLLSDIKEGFHYLFQRKLLAVLFLFYFALWGVESSIDLINAVYLQEILKKGTEQLGILNSFYFVGSFLGSMATPFLCKKIEGKWMAITPAFLYTLFYVGLYQKMPMVTFCIGFIIIGFSTGMFHIRLMTFLQNQVEERMRARVFGFYQFILNGAPLVGFGLIGLGLKEWGLFPSILLWCLQLPKNLYISVHSRNRQLNFSCEWYGGLTRGLALLPSS